jgi:hypothetical protein
MVLQTQMQWTPASWLLRQLQSKLSYGCMQIHANIGSVCLAGAALAVAYLTSSAAGFRESLYSQLQPEVACSVGHRQLVAPAAECYGT